MIIGEDQCTTDEDWRLGAGESVRGLGGIYELLFECFETGLIGLV